MVHIIKTILIYYLPIVNLITFLLFYIDKKRAHNNKFRISENTLIFISMIGGSLGAIIASNIFRHKTQKFKFKFWLPLFLFLHLILLYFL